MRSMIVVLIAAAIITAALGERVNYEGCVVYRLLPTTDEELHLIRASSEVEIFDVWSSIGHKAAFVDVMVYPNNQVKFSHFLSVTRIHYKIIIQNLESTIQHQLLTRLLTPKVEPGQISFSNYHTYEEIQAYIHKLAETHPHVTLENIGKSLEGRDLNVVKISSDPSVKKPIIFIDGGIHAREWISPATVLYIIHQLVENPQFSSLFQNVDWHIIPTLNPDGYSYTFTNDRLWRKTRSINEQSSCKGTDANRNFGYNWGGVGSGSAPCGETYRGKRAFSESETEALRDYILQIKSDVKLYLSFHSYGNYILYPWGHTTEYPENSAELQALAVAVAQEIKAVAGTLYTVGSSSNVLYANSGSSVDWVMAEAGVELSYTIELPGSFWGFVLPPEQILPVVEETWEGILKFSEYVESKYVVK